MRFSLTFVRRLKNFDVVFSSFSKQQKVEHYYVGYPMGSVCECAKFHIVSQNRFAGTHCLDRISAGQADARVISIVCRRCSSKSQGRLVNETCSHLPVNYEKKNLLLVLTIGLSARSGKRTLEAGAVLLKAGFKTVVHVDEGCCFACFVCFFYRLSRL
jgi:hypothetical protein